MSVFEGIGEALASAAQAAKDVDVEKIAAVGLVLIAGASIAAKAVSGGASAAIDVISDISDAVTK